MERKKSMAKENLVETFKSRAIAAGLLTPEDDLDAAQIFLLVRDMPYARASSRDPEVIIAEWRGTCSGKHYLLKALFAELGYPARVIACTAVTHIDPQKAPEELRELLVQSGGRFVDVHNYLIVDHPHGEMIVDATWPLSTRKLGAVVNEHFVWGEDHDIASQPIQSWEVPEDVDAQAFKDELLTNHFTAEELAHRDKFIKALSKVANKQ